MIADPNASESKAKTIAGRLPNCLPIRDNALGPTSGLCAQARYSISSSDHENGDHQRFGHSVRPKPMICPQEACAFAQEAHLD
jgi:hypothetical protein